jgi:putative FmdB family regulatory protein
MPIYEFECEECGKVFEELVLGSNASNVKCKNCGSQKVRKLISQVAFKSGGKFVSASSSGCSGCSGGSCSTCK